MGKQRLTFIANCKEIWADTSTQFLSGENTMTLASLATVAKLARQGKPAVSRPT
jgi:hypothetical protein